MDAMKQGWFSEINDLWPGMAQSLEVEKVLYSGQSKYQNILVLETKSHGRALILDGVIQCTEKDEFSYQEMISFLPICCHPNPKTVLIVGGGDCGVTREVSKFPTVEEIIQVEIDQDVVELSKKYFPFMTTALTNPKVKVHIGDGYEFIKQYSNKFDVIITDSSDPIGPAVSLFQENYFALLKTALKEGGIICSQAGTVWANLDQVETTIKHCKAVFPKVGYGITSVPTYPTGQIGFILGSLNSETNFEEPIHSFTEEELNKMNMLYYSKSIHQACFALPRFAKKKLQSYL